MRSLKSVAIPEPPQSPDYVRDRAALVALGKALFWDMQAGSDGRTACATCHFHAGADHRQRNQVTDPNQPFPVNLLLDPVIFPFRWLSDPSNRGSEVLRDTSIRAGSAGLFRRRFKDIVPGQAAEIGEEVLDRPEFSAGGLHVRRITTRNSPSVINAVFHVRNFWDGRASRTFNGFTPSGSAADAPGVLVVRDGRLAREAVRLDNSSLASQAVGPAMDALEMSYEGRTWPKLGKKMLSLPPLALQKVAADDSVLGPMARAGGRGLQDAFTYLGLIQAAFHPSYWESAQLVNAAGETAPAGGVEFTQAEYNFSLFWGMALQAYQSTLVSSDTRFDRLMEGEAGALTAEEDEGRRFFQANGRCTNCHGGAEFTAASFTALTQGGRGGNGNRAFQRTGVRPVAEDIGTGNGAFKSSALRNVELTGPYFHNGGQATLEQVVEFYSRGGDFAPNNNNIRPFNANSTQRAALVAFMKALTDDRVRFERAPFDHPELCVPDGHPEAGAGVLSPGGSPAFPRAAAERWVAIPAVGAGGNQAPLQTFEELLAGIGATGGRAHHMQEACTAPLP
ncbi:MAG: cytochrome c peroxidase [Bryobacteraceae bacterium]|nr:cytochrome c peroxidase [Bryobacteraceae bacterium]